MNTQFYPPVLSGIVVLILSCQSLTAQIYINQLSSLPSSGSEKHSKDVQIVDIDSDGDLDILLANEFEPNSLLFNDGSGHFFEQDNAIPNAMGDTEDIGVGDLDNDGDLDIIFINEGGGLHEYYLNNGAGTFSHSTHFLPNTRSNAIAIADVNNDNHLDIFLGNHEEDMLLINDGNGGFINQTIDRLPLINDMTYDAKFADIDNDDDLDILTASTNGNRIFVNDGNGVYTDRTSEQLPSFDNLDTRKITLADVDNDGDLDVFWANVEFITGSSPQNSLLLNNGNGFFNDVTASHLPQQINHTLEGIFVDIDMDGALDLLTVNIYNDPVKVFINNGTGVFQDVSSQAIGIVEQADPYGIVAGDIDGDNYKDIYVCQKEGKDLLLIRDPSVDLVITAVNSPVTKSPIQFFPNPAIHSIHIKWDKPNQDSMQYQIFDINGRAISNTLFINQSDTVIDVSSLSSGKYFISLETSSYQHVEPFIITR